VQTVQVKRGIVLLAPSELELTLKTGEGSKEMPAALLSPIMKLTGSDIFGKALLLVPACVGVETAWSSVPTAGWCQHPGKMINGHLHVQMDHLGEVFLGASESVTSVKQPTKIISYIAGSRTSSHRSSQWVMLHEKCEKCRRLFHDYYLPELGHDGFAESGLETMHLSHGETLALEWVSSCPRPDTQEQVNVDFALLPQFGGAQTWTDLTDIRLSVGHHGHAPVLLAQRPRQPVQRAQAEGQTSRRNRLGSEMQNLLQDMLPMAAQAFEKALDGAMRFALYQQIVSVDDLLGDPKPEEALKKLVDEMELPSDMHKQNAKTLIRQRWKPQSNLMGQPCIVRTWQAGTLEERKQKVHKTVSDLLNKSSQAERSERSYFHYHHADAAEAICKDGMLQSTQGVGGSGVHVHSTSPVDVSYPDAGWEDRLLRQIFGSRWWQYKGKAWGVTAVSLDPACLEVVEGRPNSFVLRSHDKKHIAREDIECCYILGRDSPSHTSSDCTHDCFDDVWKVLERQSTRATTASMASESSLSSPPSELAYHHFEHFALEWWPRVPRSG